MSESHNPIWRWPIALSALTTLGLVAALFADGWIDMLACAAIATPLLVIVMKLRPRTDART
jgi:energy-converting hydrogenase Eha subunit C